MMLQFKPLGDQGLLITLGQEINPETSQKIKALAEQIKATQDIPILELVPAYTTLAVYYNPLKITHAALVERLQAIIENDLVQETRSASIIEIPTIYGGEYGPDLGDVALYNNLTCTDVVNLHTSKPYLIYMLGFTPGFPYLGGMSKKIATPRLANPRPKVLAGSVGIADQQTGIYPQDSPGGWRIIGRTPLKLYDPNLDFPFLLNAGDYLRFISIDEKRYKDIEEQISKRSYQINRYPYDAYERGD